MSETKDATLREQGFVQVCVWPGTLLGDSTPEEFEEWITDTFKGTRAKYLENVLTNPDLDNSGYDVDDTGGRSDLFFAVHGEDIGKFALARLEYGIRWFEDVISEVNEGSHLYDDDVKVKYQTW